MKIVRTNNYPTSRTFVTLAVGDVFRYRNRSCNNNYYIKVGSHNHGINAVMLINGSLYEIAPHADVILQEAELKVRDA